MLVNRAVSGNYNLGSTIKPFVAWSAMHAGIIRPGDKYVDEGYYTLQETLNQPDGLRIEDCQHKGGLYRCVFKNAFCGSGLPCMYGPVNVVEALAVSSDAYFYRIGEKFYWASGDGRSDEPVEGQPGTLGFGNKTGCNCPSSGAAASPTTPSRPGWWNLVCWRKGRSRGSSWATRSRWPSAKV